MKVTGATRRRHPVRLVLVVFLVIVACVGGSVLAISASPRLLAMVLGLKAMGSLEDAFPVAPTRMTLDGEQLDQIEVTLGSQVADPVTLASTSVSPGQSAGEPLIGSARVPGTTQYLVRVDQESLNRLARDVILPEAPSHDRYREVMVDLRPGGLVIHADVDLGMRWHRVGLLLRYDPRTRRLAPAGVALGGEVYAMPDSDSLARVLLPEGRAVQNVLDGLTIVGPLPGEARVEQVGFHEDHLEILAQARYPVAALPDTGWRTVGPGVEFRELDVVADVGRAVERLSIIRLDPASIVVRVHYEPGDPQVVSEWSRRLNGFLVVNGGYFSVEDGGMSTTGLLISDGQPSGTPLQDHAGMLAVTGAGEVSVRWLRQWPYDPQEPLIHALQSFPVLVKPGGEIGFPADGDDGARARRTIVAQDVRGNILFGVAARGRITLHELAVFLAGSDLDVDVALNLDGGSSSGLWLRASDVRVTIDSFTPVPSVISVTPEWAGQVNPPD